MYSARCWLCVIFETLQHFVALATTEDDRLVLRSARSLVLSDGDHQEVVRIFWVLQKRVDAVQRLCGIDLAGL